MKEHLANGKENDNGNKHYTDDEIMEINGNRDILAGKIQEKYGIAKDEANKQIDQWAEKLKI